MKSSLKIGHYQLALLIQLTVDKYALPKGKTLVCCIVFHYFN